MDSVASEAVTLVPKMSESLSSVSTGVVETPGCSPAKQVTARKTTSTFKPFGSRPSILQSHSTVKDAEGFLQPLPPGLFNKKWNVVSSSRNAKPAKLISSPPKDPEAPKIKKLNRRKSNLAEDSRGDQEFKLYAILPNPDKKDDDEKPSTSSSPAVTMTPPIENSEYTPITVRFTGQPKISKGKPPMAIQRKRKLERPSSATPPKKKGRKATCSRTELLRRDKARSKYQRKNLYARDRRQKQKRPVKPESPVVVEEAEGPAQLSDSGIWRPSDDLRLIINMEQRHDFEDVRCGVRFSCNFTFEEIKQRWHAILFDQATAKVTQTAIGSLNPKVRLQILSTALFSRDEERLLKSVDFIPTRPPDKLIFRELLANNRNVFIKTRTHHQLYDHWCDLRNHHLLNNQDVKEYFSLLPITSLDEAFSYEEILAEGSDENTMQQLIISNRKSRRQIRTLEEEINQLHEALNLVVCEDNLEFEPAAVVQDNAYALLRGQEMRYVMTSTEITLGRRTRDNMVDADLSLEGSHHRVSRRQGLIRLLPSGDFIITNTGRHSILVDGIPVFKGRTAKLNDNSIIEIAHLAFTFIINHNIVNCVRTRYTDDVPHTNVCEAAGIELMKPPPPKKPRPKTLTAKMIERQLKTATKTMGKQKKTNNEKGKASEKVKATDKVQKEKVTVKNKATEKNKGKNKEQGTEKEKGKEKNKLKVKNKVKDKDAIKDKDAVKETKGHDVVKETKVKEKDTVKETKGKEKDTVKETKVKEKDTVKETKVKEKDTVKDTKVKETKAKEKKAKEKKVKEKTTIEKVEVNEMDLIMEMDKVKEAEKMNDTDKVSGTDKINELEKPETDKIEEADKVNAADKVEVTDMVKDTNVVKEKVKRKYKERVKNNDEKTKDKAKGNKGKDKDVAKEKDDEKEKDRVKKKEKATTTIKKASKGKANPNNNELASDTGIKNTKKTKDKIVKQGAKKVTKKKAMEAMNSSPIITAALLQPLASSSSSIPTGSNPLPQIPGMVIPQQLGCYPYGIPKGIKGESVDSNVFTNTSSVYRAPLSVPMMSGTNIPQGMPYPIISPPISRGMATSITMQQPMIVSLSNSPISQAMYFPSMTVAMPRPTFSTVMSPSVVSPAIAGSSSPAISPSVVSPAIAHPGSQSMSPSTVSPTVVFPGFSTMSPSTGPPMVIRPGSSTMAPSVGPPMVVRPGFSTMSPSAGPPMVVRPGFSTMSPSVGSPNPGFSTMSPSASPSAPGSLTMSSSAVAGITSPLVFSTISGILRPNSPAIYSAISPAMVRPPSSAMPPSTSPGVIRASHPIMSVMSPTVTRPMTSSGASTSTVSPSMVRPAVPSAMFQPIMGPPIAGANDVTIIPVHFQPKDGFYPTSQDLVGKNPVFIMAYNQPQRNSVIVPNSALLPDRMTMAPSPIVPLPPFSALLQRPQFSSVPTTLSTPMSFEPPTICRLQGYGVPPIRLAEALIPRNNGHVESGNEKLG